MKKRRSIPLRRLIWWCVGHGYTRFFLLGSDYVFSRTANMIINAQCAEKGVEVVCAEYAQTDFNSDERRWLLVNAKTTSP